MKAKEIKVSKNGFSTLIIYEDGSKRTVNYNDIKGTFQHPKTALNEYLLRIWFLSNNAELSERAIDEIKKKFGDGNG